MSRVHSEAGASSSEVFTEEKLIADCKLPILHVLAVTMTAWQFLAPISSLLPPFTTLLSDFVYRGLKLQVAGAGQPCLRMDRVEQKHGLVLAYFVMSCLAILISSEKDSLLVIL